MLQAIVTTTFQYPDGDFGITCSAQWGTCSDTWREDLDIEVNHREAATCFAIDRGWLARDPAARTMRLVGGALPGSAVAFAWVLVTVETGGRATASAEIRDIESRGLKAVATDFGIDEELTDSEFANLRAAQRRDEPSS